MSDGINKVILVGNLGADPEIRRTQDGKLIVNLRIGTSETWKGKDGTRQQRTEWHRVVIFNENIGRIAEQYLRKGSKVYLEGQIQTRKWQDQSGQDRYSTEVVLQGFQSQLTMLDSAPRQGDDQHRPGDSYLGGFSDGRPPPAPAYSPPPPSQPRYSSTKGNYDDDIPF